VCDGNICKLNTFNDYVWNYQWITSHALYLYFIINNYNISGRKGDDQS